MLTDERKFTGAYLVGRWTSCVTKGVPKKKKGKGEKEEGKKKEGKIGEKEKRKERGARQKNDSK